MSERGQLIALGMGLLTTLGLTAMGTYLVVAGWWPMGILVFFLVGSIRVSAKSDCECKKETSQT
jgi:hypothetical protein